MSAISQIFLTQFKPNFKATFHLLLTRFLPNFKWKVSEIQQQQQEKQHHHHQQQQQQIYLSYP